MPSFSSGVWVVSIWDGSLELHRRLARGRSFLDKMNSWNRKRHVDSRELASYRQFLRRDLIFTADRTVEQLTTPAPPIVGFDESDSEAGLSSALNFVPAMGMMPLNGTIRRRTGARAVRVFSV